MAHDRTCISHDFGTHSSSSMPTNLHECCACRTLSGAWNSCPLRFRTLTDLNPVSFVPPSHPTNGHLPRSGVTQGRKHGEDESPTWSRGESREDASHDPRWINERNTPSAIAYAKYCYTRTSSEDYFAYRTGSLPLVGEFVSQKESTPEVRGKRNNNTHALEPMFSS